MKLLLLFLCVILCFSCIPLRIAPTIKTDRVVLAKKFKRKLPKSHAFIFEDPKDANEFYNYVNIKYELNHQDVEFNVPFEIYNQLFYFSFHEVEIPNKTLNLFPIFFDAALDSKNLNPMLEDAYMSREGNWYLAIMVTDEDMNDCLKPDYLYKSNILQYLRNLKQEYLETTNYLEALLKHKTHKTNHK